MTGWLGGTYLWVKAIHVVFVIFWMAGLFILPRYLVHWQEGLDDPAEGPRWAERAAKLRRVILTPALVIVWTLGLALAANVGLLDGVPGLGWLHAKLALVLALSAYHGWTVGYAKRLAAGESTLPPRTLRLLNEAPALATVLIVVLVIVKPI